MSAINFSNTDILTILNRVNPLSAIVGLNTLTSGTGNIMSAYNTLATIAITAGNVRVLGTVINGAAAIAIVTIEIAIGGAGSEALKASWQGNIPATATGVPIPFQIVIPIIVTPIRIAWRAASDQGTASTLKGTINLGGN